MTTSHFNHFQQYIVAGLQEMLRRVQAAENLLADEDRQQAWHLLSFALDVPEAWDETRVLLLALAPQMEIAGFRQAWQVYLIEAHEKSHLVGDWQVDAEFELQIGLLYRLSSQFSEAYQWTATSVESFARLGDRYGERRALNELAWLEQLQHKYNEASQHAERALALSDQNDIERGMSLRVLGMIANSQRKWQEAQNYHEQALALFERLGDQRRIAWGLQNLALTLNEQNLSGKAIDCYKKAAHILENLGDSFHYAIVQMNLGNAHHSLLQPEQGLQHLLKAATIFHHLADTLNIARVETNLGVCHYTLQNFQTAEQSFLTAIATYEQLGDVTWRLNAIAGLGMTYNGARQYDKAIPVLEQAIYEIDLIKEHPYYPITLNYLQQYLSEARQGQER